MRSFETPFKIDPLNPMPPVERAKPTIDNDEWDDESGGGTPLEEQIAPEPINFDSKEEEDKAKEELVVWLKRNYHDEDDWQYFNRISRYPEHILTAPDVQKAAEASVRSSDAHHILEYAKIFHFSERFMSSLKRKEKVRQEIGQALQIGDFGDMLAFIKGFYFTPQELRTPEFQQEVEEAIVASIHKIGRDSYSKFNPDDIELMIAICGLSEQPFKQAAVERLQNPFKGYYSSYHTSALELIRMFKLSDDEVREAAEIGMAGYLQGGITAGKLVETFNGLSTHFHLPKDFLDSSIAQTAGKEGMGKELARGCIFNAMEIERELKLQVRTDPEIQEAVKQGLPELLKYADATKFREAAELVRGFSIQQADVDAVIEQTLARKSYDSKYIIAHDLPYIRELFRTFRIEKEKGYEIAREALKNSFPLDLYGSTPITTESIVRVKSIARIFRLPERYTQEVTLVAFRKLLESDYAKPRLTEANAIAQEFNLPEEEVRKTALKAISKRLHDTRYGDALKLASLFNVPTKDVYEAIEQKIAKQLTVDVRYLESNLDSIKRDLAEAQLPSSLLHRPSIEAVKRLLQGNIDKNIEITKRLAMIAEIPPEEVQSIALEGAVQKLANGNLYESLEIMVAFPPREFYQNDPRLSEAMQAGVLTCLSQGKTDEAKKIAKEFSLPQSFFETPETRAAISKGIVNYFAKGQIDRAQELAKQFQISETEVLARAKDSLKESVRTGSIPHALELAQKFNLQTEFQDEYIKQFPATVQSTMAERYQAWMQRTSGTERQTLSALFALRKTLAENPDFLTNVIHPTVISQGLGSFRFFEAYGRMEKSLPGPSDAKILREIVTSQGVRSIDTILFIQGGLESQLLVSPLSENRHLSSFLTTFPAIPEIYKEYVEIQDLPNALERTKRTEALTERIRTTQQRIIDGHCEDTDLKDQTYVALIYHMFPPAMTLDRGQYKNLLANRADRQKDIPEAVLALNQDAAKSTFSISVGRYELKEGEEIDTTPWTVITTLIREENKREIDELLEDELVKTGKWLLEVLADPKRLALEQNRLLQQIYRHHRSLNGITLKGDLENRDGLMELKEYVADRMKDTVDRLLQTYAAKHPADYELLVKRATEKSIDEKAKNGMIKNMLRVLGSTSLDATQTNERLTAILNGAGIRVEGDIFDEALQRIQHIEDDAAVTEALKTFLRSLLEGAANARQSGKLSVDIVNRLLGKDYARMQEEVQKYTFIEGAEGGVTKKFRLEISKKRAHGAAGLNMGVCVAPDAKLWEKPTFANVVLWDENNIARGGMHIELVRDSWRTYVVLPGINPSMAILSSSDPVKLYDHLINFAKRIAESVNASAILIPTNPTIHSNRAEIQTIITSKKYPKFSSASSHAFSYSPHAYSWNEAYQVDV